MASARELTKLVRRLHDVCEEIATGGQARYEDYETARLGVLEESTLAGAMPGWLRTARSGSQYWAFIKRKHRHYADRREFLSAEFDPLFSVAADRPLCHLSGQGLRIAQQQLPYLAAVVELILQTLAEQAVCVASALHDSAGFSYVRYRADNAAMRHVT